VHRIGDKFNKLLVIDRLTMTASEPAVMSSKDFAALQRSASQRFAGIVRAAGIKID